MPTKKCLICDTEFRYKPSKAEKAKFCSRKCFHVSLKGNQFSAGHTVSLETRKKMSESKKGQTSPMKGKHHSEETRQKLREVNLGNPGHWLGKSRSEETKEKIRQTLKGLAPWNKGLTDVYSKETLERMSKANTGRPAWNKGKKAIPEAIEKMRLKRKNQVFPKGEEHWHWTDEPSYSTLHKWIVKEYGNPPFCEFCLKKGKHRMNKDGRKVWIIEWANISREYKREREDYRGLCRRCHMKFDGLIKSDLI